MSSTQQRSAIVACCVMLTAAGLSAALTPTIHFAQLHGELKLEAAIPHEFGNWREVRDQASAVIDPQRAAFIASVYSQTLARTYVDSHGNQVMLSIAYGGELGNERSLHYPEVCYPAQGFQISDHRSGTLAIAGRQLPVMQMVAKQGERIEPLTYWLVVGEKASHRGYEQKIAQLRYRIHGLIPDGLIFRVSSVNSDVAAAYRLQETFLGALIPALSTRESVRIAGAINTNSQESTRKL